MIVTMTETPPVEPARDPPQAEVKPVHRPTPDDFGEWSFPASDPPSTWTWDPPRD
jgi:hypothetical protein